MLKTTTIFLMLLTTSLVLSSCATKTAIVGGVEDFIIVPKGSKINDVSLPTEENKKHTVVTPKDGYWVSQKGWARIIKATSGSNPKEENK